MKRNRRRAQRHRGLRCLPPPRAVACQSHSAHLRTREKKKWLIYLCTQLSNVSKEECRKSVMVMSLPIASVFPILSIHQQQ